MGTAFSDTCSSLEFGIYLQCKLNSSIGLKTFSAVIATSYLRNPSWLYAKFYHGLKDDTLIMLFMVEKVSKSTLANQDQIEFST